MELKDYQRRALDALRTFLDQAAIRPHARSLCRRLRGGRAGRLWRDLSPARRFAGHALLLPSPADRRRQDAARRARDRHRARHLSGAPLSRGAVAGHVEHDRGPDAGRAEEADAPLSAGTGGGVRRRGPCLWHRRAAPVARAGHGRRRDRHRRHRAVVPRQQCRRPQRLQGRRGAGAALRRAARRRRRRAARGRRAPRQADRQLRQPDEAAPPAGDRGRGAQLHLDAVGRDDPAHRARRRRRVHRDAGALQRHRLRHRRRAEGGGHDQAADPPVAARQLAGRDRACGRQPRLAGGHRRQGRRRHPPDRALSGDACARRRRGDGRRGEAPPDRGLPHPRGPDRGRHRQPARAGRHRPVRPRLHHRARHHRRCAEGRLGLFLRLCLLLARQHPQRRRGGAAARPRAADALRHAAVVRRAEPRLCPRHRSATSSRRPRG